jgi:hypothetical protein
MRRTYPRDGGPRPSEWFSHATAGLPESDLCADRHPGAYVADGTQHHRSRPPTFKPKEMACERSCVL